MNDTEERKAKVKELKYLGSTVCVNGVMEVEMNHRLSEVARVKQGMGCL